MTVRIITGDCREVLKTLPDNSVHCCTTSPPYWSLRDYGVAGQIGLEPSYQDFIAEMVAVFREVRRVLRADGTLWLNLGDSYANDGKWGGATGGKHCDYLHGGETRIGREKRTTGLKPKDLCGIPWRVAFALQADGWWLRQDIIWCLSGGAWLYAKTASGVGPVMLKDLVRLKPETVELWTGERWTKVVAWTKRQGRADAIELVLRSGERVGCTNNHVWPTQRGNVRTDELKVGDTMLTTRLPTGEVTAGWLTEDAFWFAGLYLAEGSRSGDTIQIAGHVKESERVERVRALVAHYGGTARVYNHRGNSQNIHIDSHGLAAVLRTLVAGHTAKDKHLTASAWQFRNWALKHLVEGYLHGDGHQDGSRFRLGFCRNYGLERDLRCLAARLGATLTLKPTMARNQSGSFPAFRGEWRWERSGHHNERDRGEIVEIRRSRARQFWDVTVADDPHLFALASGVLTHNSKPNPMPESVTDRCTKAHEYLFLLSKSEKYYFDQEAILEDCSPNTHARLSQNVQAQIGSERAHAGGKTNGNMKAVGRESWKGSTFDGPRDLAVRPDTGRKRAAPGSGIKNNDSFAEAVCMPVTKRNKRSVWEVATQPFSEAHFATFPPALIEPCILAGCPKGGCVLDPFGGAGTTGLVADRLQRDAVLIELNPEYAEMARRRIIGDAPLFARAAE